MGGRDDRAWLAVMDRAYRAEGAFALRFQTCGECGRDIAGPLTSPPPADCSEHSHG